MEVATSGMTEWQVTRHMKNSWIRSWSSSRVGRRIMTSASAAASPAAGSGSSATLAKLCEELSRLLTTELDRWGKPVDPTTKFQISKIKNVSSRQLTVLSTKCFHFTQKSHENQHSSSRCAPT